MTFLLLVALMPAGVVEADSERGAKLFESLHCVQCHGMNGRGGSIGPDLGRLVDREFTPTRLAAAMWNHAPSMWAAMNRAGIQHGDLDEQGAADLFAYFASTRFFDKRGDAGRGKGIFAASCQTCHGSAGPGKTPDKWDGLTDPMALVEGMWNHSNAMVKAGAGRKVAWPVLNGQELTDLQVYLRNQPGQRGKSGVYRIGAVSNGETVFKSSGCPQCHKTGAAPLQEKIRKWTLSDIGASMWNHAPRMVSAPARFAPGEMRDLLAFLWARQFYNESGDATRGAKIYAANKCNSCHAMPKRQGFNAAGIVSALWMHGPQMQAQFVQKGLTWPRFETAGMLDLIAFLNRGSTK